MAVEVTQHLIMHINALLAEYPQCAKLELKGIIKSAEIVWDINPEDMKENWKEYLVTVSVKPSGGVFEGTLLNYGHNWTVRGDVSRLNLYGDQSLCVNDPRLKLYCYCVKDSVNSNYQNQSVATLRNRL
ncbi:hypothetical protein O0L34_g11478 [Tuta absoluta]|nr:hypothetical protein O0L34_g11478 [Tuta absoluta]